MLVYKILITQSNIVNYINALKDDSNDYLQSVQKRREISAIFHG
jgi:hypothetical protein